MEQSLEKQIKKIKVRQIITLVLTTVFTLIPILMSMPIQLVENGEYVFYTEGISFFISIPLALFIFFIGFMVYGIISVPVINAFNNECDPEKFLQMSNALIKGQPQKDNTMSAYMYMGRFAEALPYLDQIISSKSKQRQLSACFLKAQCGFFLGEREMLRVYTDYYMTLVSTTKSNEKRKAQLLQMQASLFLMAAIADGDKDTADRLRKEFQPWRPDAKVNICFTNYLLGVAAKMVGDKEECTYRLMYVKENAPKTFFGRYAANMLSGMAEADGAFGE